MPRQSSGAGCWRFEDDPLTATPSIGDGRRIDSPDADRDPLRAGSTPATWRRFPMDDVVRQIISRRRFLQLTAFSAVAAACTPAATGTPIPAGPSTAPGGSAPAGSGGTAPSTAAITGTINVSYPDEAGL